MTNQMALGLQQKEHLERVNVRIGDYIVDYLNYRLAIGRPGFTAGELRDRVADHVPGIAPGSTDRILRDLRVRGRINYRVVSRRNSLYEALPVEEMAR
jgi:hypothetical protein